MRISGLTRLQEPDAKMHLQADSAVFEALDRRSCSYHVDLMQAKCQGFPVSAHKKSLSNMGAESAKLRSPGTDTLVE